MGNSATTFAFLAVARVCLTTFVCSSASFHARLHVFTPTHQRLAGHHPVEGASRSGRQRVLLQGEVCPCALMQLCPDTHFNVLWLASTLCFVALCFPYGWHAACLAAASCHPTSCYRAPFSCCQHNLRSICCHWQSVQWCSHAEMGRLRCTHLLWKQTLSTCMIPFLRCGAANTCRDLELGMPFVMPLAPLLLFGLGMGFCDLPLGRLVGFGWHRLSVLV